MRVSRWLLSCLALAALVVARHTRSGVPVVPVLPLAAEPAPSCPLTPVQEQTAVLAFEEMMPVIRHPRCVNCHGGVNPLVPYEQGGHMGGFIDTTQIPHSSVQTIREVCQECHSQLEGWDTPGEPMHWVGKSTKQICMQFKRLSHDPADFIGHITNEHGGVQFIETAFKGERALNDMGKDLPGDDYGKPFKVEKPPGTHQDLIRQGTDWANAVGPKGWEATPECGCEIRKNAWIGTTTAVTRIEGPPYTVEEKATATVLFDLEEKLSRGVPQQYWKSVAGQVRWEVTFSGRCNGNYTGTTPIVLGGDGNPMALIQVDPERKDRYSASLAPWQDQYYPVTTVPCQDAPPLELTLPRFVGEFWRHDPAGGTVTGKGTLIEGTYEVGQGKAEQRWAWSFRKITASPR